MQELIELIVNNKTRLDIIEKNQQMWIEKEKEQILDAYTAACEMNYGDIDSDVIDLKGEEYYNQNYNENK